MVVAGNEDTEVEFGQEFGLSFIRMLRPGEDISSRHSTTLDSDKQCFNEP